MTFHMIGWPHRSLAVAGVLFVVVAASVGIVAAQQFGQNVNDQVRALVGEGGVVHISGEQSGESPDESATFEVWIDTLGARAKQVTYDASGVAVEEILIVGRERIAYNFRDNVATKRTGSDEDDPILRQIATDLWHLGARYQLGQAEVLGDSEINGRPAIDVRLSSSGPAVSVTASLDRETLLPLEERYLDEYGRVVGSRSTRYLAIEPLDRMASDAFTSSAPPGRLYETRTHMTLAQAQAFQDFDLYYVGEAIGDKRVFWIEHDERFQVYEQEIGPPNVVLIHYTTDGKEPSHGAVSSILVRTERATPDDLAAWEKKGRVIGDGIVRQVADGDFRLELLKGGVLVTLQAPTEAGVDAMLQQVTKLN